MADGDLIGIYTQMLSISVALLFVIGLFQHRISHGISRFIYAIAILVAKIIYFFLVSQLLGSLLLVRLEDRRKPRCITPFFLAFLLY